MPTFAVLLQGLSVLFADEAGSAVTLPSTFWPGFLAALLYGPFGIALAVLGFKVFDWITPRLDIQKELAEKQNIAVAIVCGAIIVGVCYVVATVVH
jgi:putative membrane protein